MRGKPAGTVREGAVGRGPEPRAPRRRPTSLLGELLPAAGACGGDPEDLAGRRGQDSWCAHRRGQGRADGGGRPAGGGGGAAVPSRLLRVSAASVCSGRGRQVPGALLVVGLGDRSGHPEVLRQRALGPDRQGGAGQHRSALGRVVRGAVAHRSLADVPTVRRTNATVEPRRALRSHPCSPICSCTVRSTCGWRGSFRTCRSSVTSMTRWCTAGTNAMPAGSRRRSGSGWRKSGCGCTRTKPGSCTARTGNGPAVSKDRTAKMGEVVRSWRLHRHTTFSERDLARWINPIVSGWMNYYGRFYRSQLYPLLRRINAYLVRWMRKKYKRLRIFRGARGMEADDPSISALLCALALGPRVLAVRLRGAR